MGEESTGKEDHSDLQGSSLPPSIPPRPSNNDLRQSCNTPYLASSQPIPVGVSLDIYMQKSDGEDCPERQNDQPTVNVEQLEDYINVDTSGNTQHPPVLKSGHTEYFDSILSAFDEVRVKPSSNIASMEEVVDVVPSTGQIKVEIEEPAIVRHDYQPDDCRKSRNYSSIVQGWKEKWNNSGGILPPRWNSRPDKFETPGGKSKKKKSSDSRHKYDIELDDGPIEIPNVGVFSTIDGENNTVLDGDDSLPSVPPVHDDRDLPPPSPRRRAKSPLTRASKGFSKKKRRKSTNPSKSDRLTRSDKYADSPNTHSNTGSETLDIGQGLNGSVQSNAIARTSQDAGARPMSIDKRSSFTSGSTRRPCRSPPPLRSTDPRLFNLSDSSGFQHHSAEDTISSPKPSPLPSPCKSPKPRFKPLDVFSKLGGSGKKTEDSFTHDCETVKNVAVIFNHGASYPESPLHSYNDFFFPWPDDACYDTQYGGCLATKGMVQAERLGSIIGGRYSSIIPSLKVKCYSASDQAAYCSLLSFYEGFRRENSDTLTPAISRYPGDLVPCNDWVPIIMSRPGPNPLFACDNDLPTHLLRRELMKNSDEVIEIHKMRKYDIIFGKLHNITGNSTLKCCASDTIDKTIDCLETISKIGDLITVYEQLGYPVLPGHRLKESEIAQIMAIRQLVKESQYHIPPGSENSYSLNDLSKRSTIMLLSEITDNMMRYKDNFTIFAGNTMNLMSIMASIGVKSGEVPTSCDYLLIEQHTTADGEYIKFIYGGLGKKMYNRSWVKQHTYQTLESLPEGGSFTMDDWVNITVSPQYIMLRNCIVYHEDYLSETLDLCYISPFDTDNDGFISLSDMIVYFSYTSVTEAEPHGVYALLSNKVREVLNVKTEFAMGIPVQMLAQAIPMIRWDTV